MLRRCLVLLLLCGGLQVVTAAPITMELAVGTAVTALSTEMNNIASNGWTGPGPIIDNRIVTATLTGYLICRVEASVTYAANPTPGGAITGYFLRTVDGTTFENTPTASVGLNRLPDFVLAATTGVTGTRVMADVRCPAERFKAVVQNTASGQAWAASGNTIRILPITIQGN